MDKIQQLKIINSVQSLLAHATVADQTNKRVNFDGRVIDKCKRNWDSEMKECRFYEKKFPDVEEVVVVVVNKVEEQGVYVSLLEYGGIEGMIQASQLSRRRIRSVARILKVGRNEAVTVLRVDEEKGYLDLSKSRVRNEEARMAEEKYNKAKLVHQTMRGVADYLKLDLETLYTLIGWPLYKKYGHAYDAFRMLACGVEIENIWDYLEGLATDEELKKQYLSKEVKDTLLRYIARRLTPPVMKIRADVDMTCSEKEGVNAIKAAMQAAMSKSTSDCKTRMVYVAAPVYCLTVETTDKVEGIKVAEAAIEEAKKSIEASKGKLVVRMEPKVMTDHETSQWMSIIDEGDEDEQDDDDEEEEEEDDDGDEQDHMGSFNVDQSIAVTVNETSLP